MRFDLSENFESKVSVLSSSIHGLGIFTVTEIPENKTIMEISGEIIDEKECVRRENEENNVYIFWNGDSYIDAAESDKIRYINHCCDPNCEVVEDNNKRLYLKSIRKIISGEELTIDYGYPEIYKECGCLYCSSIEAQ